MFAKPFTGANLTDGKEQIFFLIAAERKHKRIKKKKNPAAVLSLQGRRALDSLGISTAKGQGTQKAAFPGCGRGKPLSGVAGADTRRGQTDGQRPGLDGERERQRSS